MEVFELIKQLAVAVPIVIVATQTITAAIHGVFTITNSNAVHAISWIVAILSGLAFVLCGQLTFGLPVVWDYVLGAVTGLIAGGAANGLYDWPSIKKIFDAITALFTPKRKR